jgi:hypothetical protein
VASDMFSLDAIRAKFARASEHEGEWNRVVDDWLSRNPHRYSTRQQDDGWFVVSIHTIEDLPVAAALAFADFVHNLRATLDHIAWSLVAPARRGAQVAFPVCLADRDWPSALGRLPAVTASALEIVEGLQPFQLGQRAQEHPLSVLHRLDIATKHRLLLRQQVHVLSFEPTFHLNRPARDGDGVAQELPAGPIELVDVADLLRVRPVSDQGDLRVVKVDPLGLDAGFGPSLTGTGVSQLDHLPNLLVFVGTAIEQLAPFVDGSPD